MKTYRHRTLLSTAIGILAAIGLGSTGQADVTVVRKLRLESPSATGAVRARSAYQLRGTSCRRETEITVSGMMANRVHYPAKMITLVSLEQGDAHLFDSRMIGFHKVPLSKLRKHLAKVNEPDTTPDFHITQSWSRVLPDDSTRKINGTVCSAFTYEWRFQAQNEDGSATREYAVRNTIWLAPINPGLQKTLVEESGFKKAYYKKMGGAVIEDLNGVALQYASQVIGIDKETLYEGLSGGTTRLKKIIGYPVASRTQWTKLGFKKNTPLFTVHSELENLSLAPVTAAIFTPKKDFFPEDDYFNSDAQLLSSLK